MFKEIRSAVEKEKGHPRSVADSNVSQNIARANVITREDRRVHVREIAAEKFDVGELAVYIDRYLEFH